MKRVYGLIAVALLAVTAPLTRAAGELELKGKIDAVTVYRGQALVSRLVDIPGPAGLKEIVVTELPEQVEPGSIYAESADGVEVRSVSYRVHPVEKDVRQEVQKLDDQIRDIQDKLNTNERKRQLLAEQKEYMGKLEQFTASTGTIELSKGVLNAETLTKLTQFQFDQRSRIADEELRLGVEQRTLNDQLQTLQRQRSQIATSSSKIAREAVVFVNLSGASGRIRVRYIVNNATWMPSYNVRVAQARSNVTVEYLASIQQLSGEDWPDVQMMLSTATPSLVAKAPILNELAITMTRPGQGGAPDVLAQIEQSGGSEQARLYLRQQQQDIATQRGIVLGNSNNFIANQMGQQSIQDSRTNTINLNGTVVNLDFIGDNNDLDLVLNKTAGDLQLVDLLSREGISRKSLKTGAASEEQGPAITYQLANRTSLPSRSDRQLIQIASIPLKATFYKVASPVLASYVYDEASVINDSSTVFLSGDLATYVNNEFVGRGVMPSVPVGQSFNVGLGVDSSLRATRQLVEKTETPQGGNRVVEFTYRLTVENFGSRPASVRLLDRLPTAKEAEIRVTLAPLGSNGRELSKDPIYVETEKKKGILRWEVEVPAQAVDVKALAVEYQFKLEYDRQMTISSAAPAPASGFGAGGRGGRGPAPSVGGRAGRGQ